MQGPSQARSSPGASPAPWPARPRSRRARRPPARASRRARQPPRGHRAASSTGRQSATPRCRPGHARWSRRHRRALRDDPASAACSRSTRTPCTWRSHTGRAPSAAAKACRLAATASGASPTAAPRLKLSKGALLRRPGACSWPRQRRPVRRPGQRGSSITRRPGSVSGRRSRRPAAPCRPRTHASPAARGRAGSRSARVEDLRHQAASARVGSSPWQKRPGRAASWRSTTSSPVSTQCRYQRFLSSSDTLSSRTR
jgi:hypothetical protein